MWGVGVRSREVMYKRNLLILESVKTAVCKYVEGKIRLFVTCGGDHVNCYGSEFVTTNRAV